MMNLDLQYIKFCAYGFLKNLRFFDAFLLLFFLENGISFSQIGILYAAREIITNISEIPSGIIADSYGRKSALLSSFLIYILSFVAFYYSTNFLLLFLGMILFGLGDALRSGVHKGMIMDYLKLNKREEEKISYYGSTRAWSQRGSAISALVAGFIVLYSGNYRLIYILSVIPYLINFVNIYSYPVELNHSIKKKQRENFSAKNVVKNVIATLKKRRVFQVVNSSALHSAFLKSIKDYIQPFLLQLAILIPVFMNMDEKNRSGLVVGVAYFFIFLLTSWASRNSYKLLSFKIEKIELKTLMAGLFVGVVCGISIYLEWYWLAVFFFILIYVIENLRKPILTGFLADNVSNDILTSVISTESFYKTMATSLFAIMIGVLSDYFGVGMALLALSLFLILVTVLLDRRMAK